jgi:hypothetical protein
MQPTAIDRRPGSRPGLKGAHLPVDLRDRTLPADPPVRPSEGAHQCGEALILGSRRELVGRPALELSRHLLGRHLAEAGLELRGLLPTVQLNRPLGNDRTRVELLDHHHQAHPGGRVASEDRCRHGRRAAVTRQQRRVDVQRWPRRQGEQVGGHQLPVGHQQQAVRGEVAQRRQGFI